MRKMMVLAVMVAMAALMMAASPAMADDNDRDGFDDVTFRFVGDDFCDFFGCEDDFEEFCEEFDGDNFCDDDFDRFDFNDGFGDFEQEAESGDVDQSFDVSSTGDISNQTVGIQGVANTGNAQNQIGVIDADSVGNLDGNNNNNEDFCDFFDCDDNNDWWNHNNNNDGGDFEFEDVGSMIEVSPTNMTSSAQQVNQAATAFGK